MPPLQSDTSFNIFNDANGFEKVFHEADNFRNFLEKYRKYISSIAGKYMYGLIPRHFDLVLRIRMSEVKNKLLTFTDLIN